MDYSEITIKGNNLDFWFNFVADNPCEDDQFIERKELLQRIQEICQRLGLNTSQLAIIYDRIKSANAVKDISMMAKIVDEGFPIIQKVLEDAESFPRFFSPVIAPDIPENRTVDSNTALVDWPCYGGDISHKASTSKPGPSQGRIGWRQPLGYAWYSKPLILNNRVICASPGINTSGFIFDLRTGAILKRIERTFTRENWDDYKNNLSGSSYVYSAASSTPLLVGNEVAFNQLGAQGFRSGKKEIFFVDPESAEITRTVEAGELDYRVGHAALTGNEKYLIYPDSTQRLIEEPPLISGHNRITCLNSENGTELWSFYVGPIDAEPVLKDDRVYIGTSSGMIFVLNCDKAPLYENEMKHMAESDMVDYQFSLDGPIRSAVAISGNSLFIATCAGTLYHLDRETGEIIWTTALCEPTEGAYKQFSSPVVSPDKGIIAIASADCGCYIVSITDGTILYRLELPDWGRSAPLLLDNSVITTSLDGSISSFSLDDGNLLWQTSPSNTMILADPVIDDAHSRLLISYADLALIALDPDNGEVLWEQSLLDYTTVQGQRIRTDATASGGFFQSKPTASDGRILAGSPSRFMSAYDFTSGEILWRFEVGAAISCSPAIGAGKVVFGQQGGEDYFYCVDLITGKLVWKQSLGWVWSSAAIHDGRIFIPGCDGYVNCLDLETGAIIWRFKTGRACHPEPPVEDGIVIFGSWDHFIYALDVETGKQIWSFYTGGAPDSGAPLIADGQVFLPAISEYYNILDLHTGKVLRRFHLKNGSYNASSCYRGDNLYLSECYRQGAIPVASRIVCADNQTGVTKWIHAGGGGLSAPAAAGNCLYTASTSDPFFYCIGLTGKNEGKTLWRVAMEDRVDESVPAFYGGRAYIVSADGHLYCFV